MEYIAKLASALPKEDVLDGFARDNLAEHLWKEAIDGHHVTPQVAVILYDVHEAKVDKDGNRVTTMRIRLVQPVHADGNLRAVETVLFEETLTAHGAIFPHEVKRILAEAFRGLPRTAEQIDVIEERERDTMSPHDELRRHLERVHGVADTDLLTDTQANKRHDDDHDNGALPVALAHEKSWIGWSRADLEAAQIEAEGDPSWLGSTKDESGRDEAPALFDGGGAADEVTEFGPPTEASFPGECSISGEPIHEGDIIRADGNGGWALAEHVDADDEVSA